jgi:hypothetical protein
MREQVTVSSEKNMLQGGYLDVNIGSASRTGWNGTIGSFVIIKATNNVRKKKKRCDHVTNMHGRGTYRNFGTGYSSFGRQLLRQKNTT